MGANNNSGDDQTDDTWNLKSIEYERNQQDDEKNNGKNQDGIGERRLEFMKDVVPELLHWGKIAYLFNLCLAVLMAFLAARNLFLV